MSSPAGLFPLLVLLFSAALPLAGREKEKLSYGEGLIVNIPMPESEVEQVVEDVAQNGVIRGTREYNKDEFVSGAKAAAVSSVFPAWTEGGKVFFKLREHALDPRNFKDGSDVGTLVVRYVVLPQGDKNTVLRIDALYQEDFRHTIHPSSGSVESAEYKDIQEHLEAIEVMKKQNAEAETERREMLARKKNTPPITFPPTIQDSASHPTSEAEAGARPAQVLSSEPASSQIATGQAPPAQAPPGGPPAQTVEERVKALRQQVERLVKAPGAPLKSAPFHTASTLQSLPSGTEVLILISTPYWYGVETHDGQHGWMQRDQLEQP
jgi:hypothetical protein